MLALLFKTWIRPLICLTFIFLAVACGSAQTLDIPEEIVYDQITFGIVDQDGKSIITIPVDSLNVSNQDLSQISFDIYTNNLISFEDINALQFLNEEFDAIRFSVNELKDGDDVRIEIKGVSQEAEESPFISATVSASVEIVVDEI
ncbi:hypothetical protein BVY03_02715 [bacterium K02(2017)]|nr:hypothetical protein BVY03_02715 [bacterium K02(2017)]